VYHRTAGPAELAVIEDREAAALRCAAASLVLSRADSEYLRRHFPAAGTAPLHVLLPALRADVAALPPPPALAEEASSGGGEAAAAWAAGRRHLTCCVRLSPEKEAHRFVELLEELQGRGALARLRVVPAMCGAGWGSDYGRGLRQRLEQHVPQVFWGVQGGWVQRMCWGGQRMCAAGKPRSSACFSPAGSSDRLELPPPQLTYLPLRMPPAPFRLGVAVRGPRVLHGPR
jgi:hypothetical protein